MSSTWGERIKLSIFGGSHTEAIGVNLDGLPAGEPVDWEEILVQMARRAPGQDPTATRRKESDEPHVLCGLLDGVTTGAPLCAIVYNTNQRSKDYENLRVHPRPGHADYTAYVKYGNHQDVRGGGHFSGRMTAPLVFAGAVARQILGRRGIQVASHVASIGGVADTPFDPVSIPSEWMDRLSREYFPVIDPEAKERMRQEVEAARKDGDSVGGVVECAVTGLPVGVGNPMFDGVENKIASLAFGIPALKGIEFGSGFAGSQLRGSQSAVAGNKDTKAAVFQNATVMRDVDIFLSLMREPCKLCGDGSHRKAASLAGEEDLLLKCRFRKSQKRLGVLFQGPCCQRVRVVIRMAVGVKNQVRFEKVRVGLQC